MGRGGLFVVIYSIVLIALFITFSYLMMTVNPPPLKDTDSPSGNLTGSDELLYADEVLLPSDDFQYGLDKLPIGYKSVDINLTSYRSAVVDDNKYDFDENVNSNVRRVIPPLWPKESTTLTTRIISLATFAKTKIPAKGFRRSINEDNKKSRRQNVPRSLFLKIINDDGQPRIEIKLAADDTSKKKTRKYRSSGSKLKPEIDSSVNNTVAKRNSVSSHDYGRSVIKMEENKTLVFNINDSSISLLNESGISIIHLDELQTGMLDGTLNVEHYSNFSSFSNNFTNPVSENTVNVIKLQLLSKNASKDENDNVNYGSKINSKVERNVTVNNENRSTKINKNITELPVNMLEIQTHNHETNKSFEQATNEAVSEPHDYKSTGNLIGLMIPEATATLPFNYHFIDENEKNVFSSVLKSKRRSKRDK